MSDVLWKIFESFEVFKIENTMIALLFPVAAVLSFWGLE